ncbi:DNA primase [Lymphocystis disease virus 1]|uniref:DNA primase n=1 Tax=Fish lymphocystis disease virus TaxID=36363 RepID=UPI0000161EA3|nr:DNA primase [Lymphocystis disease virus 1]
MLKDSIKTKSMETILKDTKVGKGQTFTHVSIEGGKYLLDAYRYPLFWQTVVNNKAIHLLETRYKESPITLDFDIKETQQIYTKEILKKLHKQIINYLKEYLNVADANLIGVFLHKPFKLTETNLIKQSFHLHYPKILMNVVDLQQLIIELKEECKTILNGDYLDLNSGKVCWFIYGASKVADDPYCIKYVFNEACKSVDFYTSLKGTLYPSCFGSTDDPRILACFYLTIMPQDKEPYLVTFKTVKLSLVDKIISKKANLLIEPLEKQSKLQKLIDLLPNECSNDRIIWLEIGFCLWQITDGSNEGFQLWLSFSKRSEKFNQDECFDIWFKQMKPNSFTIASLYWFIKKYNPIGFIDYIRLYKCSPAKYYTDGSHVGIAKIIHHHFKMEFKCSSIKNHTWFKYDDVVWAECHVGVNLRRIISDAKGPIFRVLNQQIIVISNLINNEELDDEYYIWQSKLIHLSTEELINFRTQLCKIKKSLRMTQFKNSVMRECEELFFDPLFNQKIDSNPYLMAFQNGVFDFKQKLFRQGRPDDYCSKKLTINYVDYGISQLLSCNPEDFINQGLKETLIFLEQVFPDIELRVFFIRQLASAFIGGNSEKICLFWTGSGNNGKTITQTLMEQMFGPFAVKLNTSVITGKKLPTGQANPELVRTGGGVRWAVMEEPDSDERINAGILKSLTGNDTFWARDLYCTGKDTKEIIPMFKLHVICNNLPEIKYADQAVWNRVRVIPFESVFKLAEECPDTYKERLNQKIFPVDLKFSEKLSKLIEPLAYYLIYYWLNMDRLNYNPPTKVLNATKEYQNDNDIYKQFIDNNLIKQDNIILTERLLYIRYKDWLAETHPYYVVQSRNKAIKRFSDILGPLTNGAWFNLNLI